MSRSHRSLGRRWLAVRRAVLDRDGWRCRACGRAGRLEVDHILPLADGGAVFDLGNLQALCRVCHIAKTTTENRARRPVSEPERKWRDLVDRVSGSA